MTTANRTEKLISTLTDDTALRLKLACALADKKRAEYRLTVERSKHHHAVVQMRERIRELEEEVVRAGYRSVNALLLTILGSSAAGFVVGICTAIANH